MTLADSYVALARYNRWMNEKLYAVAAELSDDERKRDLHAFFPSLQATLDHILFADRIWLARFGVADGAEVRASEAGYGGDIFADFTELRRERARTDDAIDRWVTTLSDDVLAAPFRYTNMAGKPFEHPLWIAVQHFFNHQTHHRGQATTLLKQLGRDPGVTDLIALLRQG